MKPSRSPRTKQYRSGLRVIAMAVLTLAGCGSSDSESASDSTAGSPLSSAAAAPTTTTTIVPSQPSESTAPPPSTASFTFESMVDESGRLSIDIPTEWTDRVYSITELWGDATLDDTASDDLELDSMTDELIVLLAGTDLGDFGVETTAPDTPLVAVTVNSGSGEALMSDLTTDPDRLDDALTTGDEDSLLVPSDCQAGAPRDVQFGLFAGRMVEFGECANGATGIAALGWDDAGEWVASFVGAAHSDADRAALDRALGSLTFERPPLEGDIGDTEDDSAGPAPVGTEADLCGSVFTSSLCVQVTTEAGDVLGPYTALIVMDSSSGMLPTCEAWADGATGRLELPSLYSIDGVDDATVMFGGIEDYGRPGSYPGTALTGVGAPFAVSVDGVDATMGSGSADFFVDSAGAGQLRVNNWEGSDGSAVSALIEWTCFDPPS
jgi:hypothetical protein